MSSIDARQFLSWIRHTEAGLEAASHEVLARVANATRQVAATGIASKSGALVRSIHIEPAQGYLARIVADAPHARFYEYGTRPHRIEAKNGKALYFQVNGKGVFARSVNHPGTKPHPFMQKAADYARVLIVAEMRAALNKVYE